MAKSPSLSINGKLDRSSVETNKKTESSIIYTTIKGVAQEGFLSNFNKTIEEFVFDCGSWSSISFPTQAGFWTMTVSTIAKQEIAEVHGCIIDKLSFKRKDDGIAVTFKIKHPIHTQQAAIIAAVSTDILLALSPETQPMNTEEPEEGAEAEK